MSNHARGLWGYSGTTAGGRGLTVQSTGMGGPSAALVLGDLAELGVRRAVRVGTCAALDPDLRPGDLVGSARRGRGRSTAAAPARRRSPTRHWPRDCAPSSATTRRPGAVASLDVLHPSPGHATPDGDVADMQTAALFAAGRELGVALAAVLIVTDAEPARRRALADALAIAEPRLIALYADSRLLRRAMPNPLVEG